MTLQINIHKSTSSPPFSSSNTNKSTDPAKYNEGEDVYYIRYALLKNFDECLRAFPNLLTHKSNQ